LFSIGATALRRQAFIASLFTKTRLAPRRNEELEEEQPRLARCSSLGLLPRSWSIFLSSIKEHSYVTTIKRDEEVEVALLPIGSFEPIYSGG
jgi:hypothetical protein